MRNPWEIDWSNPQAAQQVTQRPRIQGPEREPAPQTAPQRVIDQNRAAATAYDPRRAEVDLRAAEANLERTQLETRQAEIASSARRAQIDALESQLNDMEVLYNENFRGSGGSGTRPGIGSLMEYAPWTASNQSFRSIASQMRSTLKPLIRGPGEGVFSDADQRLLDELIPSPYSADAYNETTFAQLRARIAAERQALGLPAQPAPAALPPGSAPPGERMDATTQQITAQGPGGRTELSRGDQQIDPARQAMSEQIRTRLSSMLKGGVADNAIRDYAVQQGVSPESIDQALQFRRTPQWQEWRRQRPNEAYPFRDESINVPMDPVAGLVAGAAASPAGTAISHAGNAVTAGTMPLWGQAFGGDPEQIRLGLDATREANPLSAMGGTIAGAAGAYSGAGRAAAALASRLPQGGRAASFLGNPSSYSPLTGRAVAGDAAYGALQGMGENNDPLSGIAENMAGGMVGRGAPRALASTVSPTGGRLAGLYAEGVRPTLGQRFRGTGPLGAGDTVNFIEEAGQSIPLGGRIIRGARERSRQQWQQARWNETLGELEPVRAVVPDVRTSLPPSVRAGTAAHQFAQREFDKAYRAVRGRLTFREDAEWTSDLGNLALVTRGLSSDHRRRWNRVFAESVQRRINTGRGALSGDDFKRAASEIGAMRRQASRNPADAELVDALGALDDALHQGARRHSAPEVVTALDATDRGYGKLVTLENASRRRLGGADADPGDFGPSDILQLGRNEGVRGRRFLRGETPFYESATAARSLEDVLPSSGTAERGASMNLMDRLNPFAGPGAGIAAGAGAMALGAGPGQIAGAASLPILWQAPGVRQALAPRGGNAQYIADLLRQRPVTRASGLFGAAGTSYGSGRD